MSINVCPAMLNYKNISLNLYMDVIHKDSSCAVGLPTRVYAVICTMVGLTPLVLLLFMKKIHFYNFSTASVIPFGNKVKLTGPSNPGFRQTHRCMFSEIF